MWIPEGLADMVICSKRASKSCTDSPILPVVGWPTATCTTSSTVSVCLYVYLSCFTHYRCHGFSHPSCNYHCGSDRQGHLQSRFSLGHVVSLTPLLYGVSKSDGLLEMMKLASKSNSVAVYGLKGIFLICVMKHIEHIRKIG